MDRQKKIPSPSTKITRKLAHESKGHSNLMNFYSKLSRDKTGAPVKWKMSTPIHVDEAAISGRSSPGKAQSSSTGKRSDVDKSGKKVREKSSSTERSKSRDSSTGSRRSRRDSIDKKPEVETKPIETKRKKFICTGKNILCRCKKKGCIGSKGKRESLSAVPPSTFLPDKIKRRPHSLDLNYIREAAVNGDDECFKSPDRLSPCNEIVKRKKGRPKQTPPKLEMEVLTKSELEQTEETHFRKMLSNSTLVTTGASKSKHELLLNDNDSAKTVTPVEDKDKTSKDIQVNKPRRRGRPPGSLNRSTLLIMKKFGISNPENAAKLKYTAQSRPSASKIKPFLKTSNKVQQKSKKVGRPRHKKNKPSIDKRSKHTDKVGDKVMKSVSSMETDQGKNTIATVDNPSDVVKSFNMNGDIDDPEVTFKDQVVHSDITSEHSMKLVKQGKNLKKDKLKTKAVASVTKFKRDAEPAPMVKKKKKIIVMISQAIRTDEDPLSHLATNDLRRKIQKKIIDRLGGHRKEVNKIEIVENKSTDVTCDENDTTNNMDATKPIHNIEMTAFDESIECELNSKSEKASEVEMLSAIIEQKRLLSKENSQPDRVRKKPGRKPKVQAVPIKEVVTDITKESDSESICSELSVQSALSESESHKRIIIDTAAIDASLIRTRQRYEILPPGGHKRKRTLSGEFHLLDEFKLRKSQRNLDHSEGHDDEEDRDFPQESNMNDTVTGSPEKVAVLKAKKVSLYSKDKNTPKCVKTVLTKGRVFGRKNKFSQPFQKKRMLSPNQYKEKQSASKLIKKKKITIAHLHETLNENLACNEEQTMQLNYSDGNDMLPSESEAMAKVDRVNLDEVTTEIVDSNNRSLEVMMLTGSGTAELCHKLKHESNDDSEPTGSTAAEVDNKNLVKNDSVSKLKCHRKPSSANEMSQNNSEPVKLSVKPNIVKLTIESESLDVKETEMKDKKNKQDLHSNNTSAEVLKTTMAESRIATLHYPKLKDEPNVDSVLTSDVVSSENEMIENTDNLSKHEVHSSDTTDDVVLKKPIPLSNVTAPCPKLTHEPNGMCTTGKREKDETNMQHPEVPTDLKNESIECSNVHDEHDTVKITNNKAILVCSSEKVSRTDTDVHELKEKLEMRKIKFDVNEVVQGILFSVEHTLKELGDVNILNKLEAEPVTDSVDDDKLGAGPVTDSVDDDKLGAGPVTDSVDDDKLGAGPVTDSQEIGKTVHVQDTQIVETKAVKSFKANDGETVCDNISNENNNTIEHISKGVVKNINKNGTGIQDEDTIKEITIETADIDEQDKLDNDREEVDNDNYKKDMDISVSEELASIESGNTEDLQYSAEVPTCKVSPESHEVTSIIGKKGRKRNSGNNTSPKDVNIVARKIELRQKISRSPLDNIALKHSIEENEYYKNEVLKANRREAKLKSKQAALLAKTADPVTNDNIPVIDVPVPDPVSDLKLEQTDSDHGDTITQESSADSEMSDVLTDTETEFEKSMTTEDLLKCCKPCSVLLIDFIKQLQINQQKLSETGSESGENEIDDTIETTTNLNIQKTVIEETNYVNQDALSTNVLHEEKTIVRKRRSKSLLNEKLISEFGSLESESGEQTARKTVPPLKIKLKGGVRRKTYMVEPTVHPEDKKIVAPVESEVNKTIGPENKPIKKKCLSLVDPTVKTEVKKTIGLENKPIKRKGLSLVDPTVQTEVKKTIGLENKPIKRKGLSLVDPTVQTEVKKTIGPENKPIKRKGLSLVDPTVQTEVKKTVRAENKTIKRKSAASKSDSDSEKQKAHHHHHKRRNKAQSVDPVISDNINIQTECSPSKPNLQPPVYPHDAYEANFLQFIKEKESLGDRIPTLASAAKPLTRTADGKAYKVQANGSLTVSASGNGATSTCTSNSDMGLNESAIAAQKKKAENAGQIMESYAKFREKIMNESLGKKVCTETNEDSESSAESDETLATVTEKTTCDTEMETETNEKLVADNTETVHQLKRFACSHCVYSTDTMFDMLEHTKSKHANDIKYICPLCEKVYVEKEAILAHCESYHSGEQVLYGCVPDFRDTMPEIPSNDSDNHGNIFDRMHDLLESSENDSSKNQGDANSLQKHYFKMSAEADSTTEAHSDVIGNDQPAAVGNISDKPKEASVTEVVTSQEDSGELQLKIVDVVSLKPQAELTVSTQAVVAQVNRVPQAELKIPNFTARFPPQAPVVNQVNPTPIVKDVVPKRPGKIGHTFKCEKCNVHAPLLAAMVAHLRNVHKDIPRLFQCPYCRDLEAESEAKIHHHIRSFHPTNNPNPPVALSEPAKSNLKTLTIPLPENKFSDSAIVEKDIYMCLKCKTHMPSLVAIYDHLEAEHIEVFVSVCPFCKTFKSKDEDIVNRHVVTAHQRSFDEIPLSLAIDGNQFVRVPSLIKDKNKHSNKSLHHQQPVRVTQPETTQPKVMSLTQQNLRQHQLQERQLMLQATRMGTNPGIVRMMSQMNPQFMSTINQSQLRQTVPQQRSPVPQPMPQPMPQTSVPSTQQPQQVVTSQHSSVPRHTPSHGAKKRKATLSDTIANLTMQKEAEQRALINTSDSPSVLSSASTVSPLPTYQQAIEIRNQNQQGNASSQPQPPPLIRGPPPLIRFDQIMAPGDGTSQTASSIPNQNVLQQLNNSGSPLSISQQTPQAPKPIHSALFDTSNSDSFANKTPVLNIPIIPRSGNRPKPPGTPLDLSSKSTPSNSPAPSPSPNIPNENIEAFKIFNLKPNTPQPTQAVQQLPIQQFVHQVRPNTSNTLAYRPTTPHVPNVTQSAQVMSMPLNAALLGGKVIVSIPNMQQNPQTVQQLQALQQLVRLSNSAQAQNAQLQNVQQLVRVGTPSQLSTSTIQQALQAPRGMAIGNQGNQAVQQIPLPSLPLPTATPQQINAQALQAPRGMTIGQVNQAGQQIPLPSLPLPTATPQQINATLNLPLFKCPYCPKLTKLAPAEVQPHIETLHPGSSIVFKQCDT